MTKQHLQPMRLLPLRRHPRAIKPRIGRLPGATQGRDNLGSGESGNLVLEAHDGILPQKKKSAMQKKELAKCPQCRHITCMTTNDIITLHEGNNETTVRLVRETEKAIQVEGNCSKGWFPKSSIEVSGKNEVTGNTVVTVKDWFINRMGLEHNFLFQAPFTGEATV